MPGPSPQRRGGTGGQPHGGADQVQHVRLSGARPRHTGAHGDLLGQQQEQAEDRDAHGEKEEQVPEDLSLEIVRRLRCVYSLHQK